MEWKIEDCVKKQNTSKKWQAAMRDTKKLTDHKHARRNTSAHVTEKTSKKEGFLAFLKTGQKHRLHGFKKKGNGSAENKK